MGLLFDKICEYENLKEAFQRARKGKTSKTYVIDFEHDLEVNLQILRNELLLHLFTTNLIYYYVILRNMEIISRISKGSKMDQVYLPKNRHGFNVGSYVVVMPLNVQKEAEKPHYYTLSSLEPIKVNIINELFSLIDKFCIYDNIIVTGSFLEKGFHFNDLDLLIITESKLSVQEICEKIQEHFGIHAHILVITSKHLLNGLATDPLYSLMLSSCVAKKRFIYKTERDINYKLLDLHLLKSKTLIDNYELLDGNEKWYLTRNMICISLFLNNKKITHALVEKETEMVLHISVKDIKRNLINKEFIKLYTQTYKKIFNTIMGTFHDTK